MTTELGALALTHFVNLLEASADGGIVVLASFVEAPAAVGAALAPASRAGGESS